MHSNEPGAARYESPRLYRFGTFREVTRTGFTGNADGGLILSADGPTAPAADERVVRGSR